MLVLFFRNIILTIAINNRVRFTWLPNWNTGRHAVSLSPSASQKHESHLFYGWRFGRAEPPTYTFSGSLQVPGGDRVKQRVYLTLKLDCYDRHPRQGKRYIDTILEFCWCGFKKFFELFDMLPFFGENFLKLIERLLVFYETGKHFIKEYTILFKLDKNTNELVNTVDGGKIDFFECKAFITHQVLEHIAAQLVRHDIAGGLLNFFLER